MKRIAWILLAAICSAFVRVQPVELAQCGQCVCCHCKVPGACGMPCTQTPTPAPLLFAAEPGALLAHPASRGAQLARASGVKFFESFVGSTTEKVASVASAPAVRAASVPLFRAHCSFLI